MPTCQPYHVNQDLPNNLIAYTPSMKMLEGSILLRGLRLEICISKKLISGAKLNLPCFIFSGNLTQQVSNNGVMNPNSFCKFFLTYYDITIYLIQISLGQKLQPSITSERDPLDNWSFTILYDLGMCMNVKPPSPFTQLISKTLRVCL